MPRPIVTKSVCGQFEIGLEYQSPDLKEGETITDVEVIISPNGLIPVGAPVIDGNIVKQIINGGVAGKDYTVFFKVTTSTGAIYCNPAKDSILVRIIF